MNGNRQRWMYAGIGIVVVVGLLFGWWWFGGDDPAEANTQEVVTAFVGDLSASATASGQLVSTQETTLVFETPGRVAEVLVRVGDEVEVGEPLMVLDTADLELDVVNAEQLMVIRQANLDSLQKGATAEDLASAEAALANAEANLADVLAGPSETDIIIAEADVKVAEASINSSYAQLVSAQESVTQSQIEAAKARFIAAEFQYNRAKEVNENIAVQQTDQMLNDAWVEYQAAKANYDTLLAGADPNSVGQAQANVASAAAQRDSVQANLEALLVGATPAEVAAAEARVAQAQADLDRLLTPATAQEIQIAEAELAQAQISLENAQERLAKAQLTAPFAGVITAVNFAKGEFASGPAVEIINHQALEVVLSVDELDIANLQVGQPAEVTLDAFPGQTLVATLASIAPSATQGSSIVNYEARLSLDNSIELPLRVGMTANARLITEEKLDVLLLPNRAIRADRQAGKYYVNVPDGETTREVEITIGLRDGQNTQILSGLEEGDQVVIGVIVPTVNFGPPED